jgi:hypothetical protein
MSETQEHPPPILKMSMAGSLGGDAGDLGVPTTYLEDADGGPLEVMLETQEHPPPILKTSMACSLGVRPLSMVQRCVVICIGSIDRSNSTHGFHSPCA